MRRLRKACLRLDSAAADRLFDGLHRQRLTPRTGYTIVKDQAYGEGPRRSLDVYLPASSTR
jgi:hypothetical protein